MGGPESRMLLLIGISLLKDFLYIERRKENMGKGYFKSIEALVIITFHHSFFQGQEKNMSKKNLMIRLCSRVFQKFLAT